MSRLVPVVSALLLLTACPSDEAGKADAVSSAEDGAASAAAEEVAKACRADDVHALAAELAAADVPTKQARVAEGLASACTLPSSFSAFLAATAPGAAANARFEAASKHTDLLDQVCPAGTTDAVGALKPLERAPVLFDKCGLGAHAVAEREDWLAHGPSSVAPFAAKAWLVEQGVAAEDASTIAKALVLRDRTRWAAPDQSLPKIDGVMRPVPATSVVVQVTPNEVRVGGTRVLSLEEGRLPAPPKGKDAHPDVEKLREAMLAEREAFPEDATVTLAFVADATVHAQTLYELTEQADDVNLRPVVLVGMSGTSGEGALPFSKATMPIDQVSVDVNGEGFVVKAKGGDPTTIAKPYDFDALEDAVAAKAKDGAPAEWVKIRADDDVPLSVLASTFARVGPSRCIGKAEDACTPAKVLLTTASATQARHDGIIAALGGHSGGAFLASPYGGAFAVGDDDEDVWGGLTGTEVGEAYGVGGLGLTGTGRGGGGTGEGTIGLGNTGLIGKGGGGGSGTGYGRGSGSGFGGGRKVAKVRQGKHTVVGSLDKTIIRRIVRAHVNEVRHCYNKVLADDASLEGTVAVDFTIASNGKVTASAVSSDSVGDGSVGTCVAKAIKRWRFPKPLGGGVVKVKYPFIFSPG